MERQWFNWKSTNSNDDYNAILKAAEPTINSALKSYVGPHITPTIQNRAKIMAHDAIKTYDPSKGTLSTHLMNQLRPISRYAQDAVTPVRVPGKRREEIYSLSSAEEELYEKLGRSATDLELSDKTGLSVRRIAKIRRSKKLDFMPIQNEDGGTVDPATNKINPEDIWIDYVYYDQDPINKKIMEWRLGLYGNDVLRTREIAKRLNISESAVSQRVNKIIGALSKFNDLKSEGIY